MPVRAPSQSYACAPTATSGSTRVPASVPSRRNARSAIESKARWFVQRSRSLSLEPSPFGLNARAARATVLEPRLASPPSPNVSPSMPASMKVAFGAVAAATYVVVDERTAIHTPLRVKLTVVHSASGPVTWYHVYPSALTGPPMIATRSPTARLATRSDAASGDTRWPTPSTTTRPKPPTASTGEASYTALTSHGPTLPISSVAR